MKLILISVILLLNVLSLFLFPINNSQLIIIILLNISGCIILFTSETYFLFLFKKLERKLKNISSGNFTIEIISEPKTVPKSILFNINIIFNQLIKSFTTLINISNLLGKEHNLEKLLNLIIEEVTKILDAERSTLFLYDKNTKELWSYVTKKLEIKEIRLTLGKGIVGYVGQTGKLLNIKNAYLDERFDSDFDNFTGFRTKTILCAPMFNSKNELLGVIQVLNKKNDEKFTAYDETILTAIANEAAIAIENTNLYISQEKLFKSAIHAIVTTIDARDPVTKGHSERVARYSIALGKKLNLSDKELKTLEYAALLHDVGKISVKDNILSKPGIYTSEEYEEVKKHAESTKQILERIYFPDEQKDLPLIAAIHHEKLDGSGYPFGLKNNDIPLLARILAVVDIYDALVAYDRPYKPAMSIEEALKTLREETDKGKLDKKLVDIFINNKLYNLEHRKFVRISKEFSIEYRVMGPDDWRTIMPLVTKTENISAAGLLFKTSNPIPINSYLEIRLHLPNYTVDTLGKIVRIKQNKNEFEIGVSFINLSDKATKELNKYLISLE